MQPQHIKASPLRPIDDMRLEKTKQSNQMQYTHNHSNIALYLQQCKYEHAVKLKKMISQISNQSTNINYKSPEGLQQVIKDKFGFQSIDLQEFIKEQIDEKIKLRTNKLTKDNANKILDDIRQQFVERGKKKTKIYQKLIQEQYDTFVEFMGMDDDKNIAEKLQALHEILTEINQDVIESNKIANKLQNMARGGKVKGQKILNTDEMIFEVRDSANNMVGFKKLVYVIDKNGNKNYKREWIDLNFQKVNTNNHGGVKVLTGATNRKDTSTLNTRDKNLPKIIDYKNDTKLMLVESKKLSLLKDFTKLTNNFLKDNNISIVNSHQQFKQNARTLDNLDLDNKIAEYQSQFEKFTTNNNISEDVSSFNQMSINKQINNLSASSQNKSQPITLIDIQNQINKFNIIIKNTNLNQNQLNNIEQYKEIITKNISNARKYIISSFRNW